MRRDRQFIRLCVQAMAGASVLLTLGWGGPALAQSSVEKSETSQQLKRAEEELKLAQEAVKKPGTKAEPPETGRIVGSYSLISSVEVGYRFVDTDGSHERYLSDVNVRDGLRLLEYSLDARSITGRGELFDYFRAEATNLGGDQSQYISVRADKARTYKLDATTRRFYYYRFLPTLANNRHNYDLRQQVSDVSLKLFPQRAVRFNLGYGRSMSKGPYGSTYTYEKDEFPINGTSRWSADDYRLGLDATYRGWTFLLDQSYRYLKNDTEYSQDTQNNTGDNTSNTSVLTFFDRVAPTRARALITRASAQGNLSQRLHLVLRGLHVGETSRLNEAQLTQGVNSSGARILGNQISSTGRATRSTDTVDAGITYDLTEHISVSNTFTYYSYDIQGDVGVGTLSRTQPASGPVQTTLTTTLDGRSTSVDSYWNTLDFRYSLGRKFSANLGWRATSRNITLRRPGVEEEEQDQRTNAFIGGVRYRPTGRVNLFFDVDRGTRNNAFVRVNPLDYTRYRVRANIQATNTLSLTATFTSTDQTNPTPEVENDADFRAVSAAVIWEPRERLWLTAGYDYDYFFSTADISFFLNSVLNQGRSVYYARQNFFFVDGRVGLTRRLDLLFVYRYLQDRGAPDDPGVPPGPNNFVTQLPLSRHNPEVRLAYRFNNRLTGNLSYRHYSYNERISSVEDYRANILTTGFRFTF
jgi:hypothetical protein